MSVYPDAHAAQVLETDANMSSVCQRLNARGLETLERQDAQAAGSLELYDELLASGGDRAVRQ